jgi:hypothetical protein
MRSPLTDPEGIDFVVIRENSEDLYPGREGDLADRPGRGHDFREIAELRGADVLRAPAFAAGMALAASQSAGFILEYSPGANPLLHELVHEKFEVVNGQLEIPDRPGLGITVDEDFVRRYARE